MRGVVCHSSNNNNECPSVTLDSLLSRTRQLQDGHLRKYICCVPNNVQHHLCSPKQSAVVPNVLVESKYHSWYSCQSAGFRLVLQSGIGFLPNENSNVPENTEEQAYFLTGSSTIKTERANAVILFSPHISLNIELLFLTMAQYILIQPRIQMTTLFLSLLATSIAM